LRLGHLGFLLSCRPPGPPEGRRPSRLSWLHEGKVNILKEKTLLFKGSGLAIYFFFNIMRPIKGRKMTLEEILGPVFAV